MPLKPPPRLADDGNSGSFFPVTNQQDSSAQAGQAGPTDEGSVNPGAMDDMQNILAITSAARKIAMKYPTSVSEVQEINDAVQRLQMKILAVQPPSEPPAPPQ